MPFKPMLLGALLIGSLGYGQKQSKTYNELFNVGQETVLEINTNNADILFETWDKNQIVVEAVITLDGATEEEAKRYFKESAIEIMGNSQKVSVATASENSWAFGNKAFEMPEIHFEHDFQFDFEPFLGGSIVGMDSLMGPMDPLNLGWAVLADMPPLPPMPNQNFDYEAFKKDGDKYMIKWQKQFSKGIDKDYEKKMEEWGEEMEKKALAMEKKREAMEKLRSERFEKMQEDRALQMEKREKEMEARSEAMEKRAAEMARKMEERNVLISRDTEGSRPNIFYFSDDGAHKNYKVKKTIKIKMPKGLKIQMNVRHGEVKLAEITKNIHATLTYSRLLAATIDGDKTSIVASYSPVTVQRWNYGTLQVDYSDKVNLKEVGNLRLSATASDITIDRIVDKVYITNKFGPISINNVASGFTDLDITLQNAELHCKTPATAFTINVNGTASELAYPESLIMVKTKNQNTVVSKGYHLSKNNGKNIVIKSNYSDVVFN
jgi:hypothetical protein